jgi:O-antigen/teichoic acid export membrane protein
MGARALARSAGERIRRAYRAALILTVGASIAVSLLGLVRQKEIAGVVGPAGLADLSLLLSIGAPIAAFALWPLVSFAKDLNNEDNPSYERALRSAAATCAGAYACGAVAIGIVGWRTDLLQFPLGTREGLVAALAFALGTVGIGYATSVLTYRGDLRRWRRLTLVIALCQAVLVAVLGIVLGRRGAVWGMAGVTGAAGLVLLTLPWLRKRGPGGAGKGAGFFLPPRWLAFSMANGTVMLTFAASESALRQGSAAISALTAAYLQASLSIIGAISAGIAQYSAGRLLPLATAARDTGRTTVVWQETRRAAAVVAGFILVICGGAALVAPTILSLAFSSDFNQAAPLLRLVIVGESCVALTTVVTSTLLGLGKTSLWATLSIISPVARVGAYVLLAGSSPVTRLGWSYATAGGVALAICGVFYARLSARGLQETPGLP